MPLYETPKVVVTFRWEYKFRTTKSMIFPHRACTVHYILRPKFQNTEILYLIILQSKGQYISCDICITKMSQWLVTTISNPWIFYMAALTTMGAPRDLQGFEYYANLGALSSKDMTWNVTPWFVCNLFWVKTLASKASWVKTDTAHSRETIKLSLGYEPLNFKGSLN